MNVKKVSVEVLSESINCPVIKLPNRKFPGVLIQGDSFNNLKELLKELEAELKKKGVTTDILDEVKEFVVTRLDLYESTLKENNISLPYFFEKNKSDQ